MKTLVPPTLRARASPAHPCRRATVRAQSTWAWCPVTVPATHRHPSTPSCWPSSRSLAVTYGPRTPGASPQLNASSVALCMRASLCGSASWRLNATPGLRGLYEVTAGKVVLGRGMFLDKEVLRTFLLFRFSVYGVFLPFLFNTWLSRCLLNIKLFIGFGREK